MLDQYTCDTHMLRYHRHIIHYITSFHLFPTTSSSHHSLHHKFPFVSYDIVVTSFITSQVSICFPRRHHHITVQQNSVFILMISHTLFHDIIASRNPVFILMISHTLFHDIITSQNPVLTLASLVIILLEACCL
jgi:hypothetical protein